MCIIALGGANFSADPPVVQTVQCGPGSLPDSEISSLTQVAMQAVSSKI